MLHNHHTCRCFIDIDGVLADFVGGALVAHGLSRDHHVTQYDLWDQLRMTPDAFWAPLSNDRFWAGLELTADAAHIIHLAEQFAGPLHTCLITCPRPCPGCHSGKFQWVRSTLPHFLDRYILTPTKALAAGEGRLLIDDSDEQVNAWRAAGGWAILLPRPWNSRRDQSGQAVEVLAEDLERLELTAAYGDA